MKEQVGPYRILSLLRQGARPLYRAHAADGRVLALKTIPAEQINPEARERFKRESAILTSLVHPNLMRVWDVGEADGVLYLAMDLLEGSNLGELLAERRPLSWAEKLSIMDQICAGLEYLHSRNQVHREIKPENLFLENSGRVRVLGFGLARLGPSKATGAGTPVGTAGYMAPEQVWGETRTAAADVFMAGIVLYELATGRHPFAAKKDPSKIATAIVFSSPPSVKNLAPDAPEGLESVIHQALEKNVAKRLRNGGELRQALSHCHPSSAKVVAAASSDQPVASPVPSPKQPEPSGAAREPSAPAPARPSPLEQAKKTAAMGQPVIATGVLAKLAPSSPVAAATPPSVSAAAAPSAGLKAAAPSASTRPQPATRPAASQAAAQQPGTPKADNQVKAPAATSAAPQAPAVQPVTPPEAPGVSPSLAAFDPKKTLLAPRAKPSSAAPARPPSPVPPPETKAPLTTVKAAPKSNVTFCPSCTHANPKGSATCAQCGLPLQEVPLQASQSSDSQAWYRNSAVVSSVLLAVVLLLIVLVGWLWKG